MSNPEAFEELPTTPESSLETPQAPERALNRVLIRRSSGEVESDWMIQEVLEDGAIVVKEDPATPGKYLEKGVSRADLLELNPDLQLPKKK